MNKPLAKPISSRPAYRPPMFVVAIMMTLETQQRRQADQMVALRPRTVAMGPAQPELRKAPSVIKDEIHCWRSGEMFQPPGTFLSTWP